MVDLVPEGCVTLPAAFDRFHGVLWNGGAPVLELRERILSGHLPAAVVGAQIASLDEVTNFELAEFARPFVEDELEALVRQPGAAENFTIPSQEWATAFFPERFSWNLRSAPDMGTIGMTWWGGRPLRDARNLTRGC